MNTYIFLGWLMVFCYSYAANYPVEGGYTAREMEKMDRLVAEAVEPDWLTELSERSNAKSAVSERGGE